MTLSAVLIWKSFGKYSEKFQSMTTMKLKIIFLIFQSEQTVLRFGTGLMKSTRKELQNYQAAPNIGSILIKNPPLMRWVFLFSIQKKIKIPSGNSRLFNSRDESV